MLEVNSESQEVESETLAANGEYYSQAGVALLLSGNAVEATGWAEDYWSKSESLAQYLAGGQDFTSPEVLIFEDILVEHIKNAD